MNFHDAKEIARVWAESVSFPDDLKGKQINTIFYLHDEKDPVLLEAKKRILSRLLKKRGARLIHETDDWSSQQSHQAVSIYMNALKRQLAGGEVTQAELKGPLCSEMSKTEKAARFKFRHISSILVNSELPYLRVFKPLPRANIDLVDWNETELLQKAILHLLNSDASFYYLFRESASESAPPQPEAPALIIGVEDPPEKDVFDEPNRKSRRMRIATKVNYAEREARNRNLGLLGEELAMAYEEHRLKLAGRMDLAERVTWVSRDVGDGLGYDIESFEANGDSRFIEVKTTKQGKYAAFYISANELEFSRERMQSFCIYRIFDFGRDPRLFILHGTVENYARVIPTTYRVIF